MIKYKSVGIYVLLLAVLFASCKSVQQGSQTKSQTIEHSQPVSNLDRDKQKEFQYLFIEGVKQRTLGNSDEAIKIFSQCLEMDPTSAAAMYEMANIHISKGDFQSSMMLLERAVSIENSNKYYHLLLAKLYQQNKLLEKAASQYRILSNLEPGVYDYSYYEASLMGMAGKTEEALALYNQLEKKLGLNESISMGRQQIYLQSKNMSAAFKEIEKLIAAFPQEPKYYGLLADLYLEDGQREKAFENFNKILQLDPENDFVHLSLAEYYKNGGELDKAFEHVKILFANPKVDFEMKGQLFLLMSQPGNNRIADDRLEELIKLLIKSHPDDNRPYLLYSDFYNTKKDIVNARKQIRLALDIQKEDYNTWERLLFLDNELLDWESLSADSKRAATFHPTQPLIYLLDAVALLQLGKYDEMFAIADTGMVHAAGNPKLQAQFYLYKAEALYKQKKADEAFKMFELVIANDPQNWMAMNNYAYYLSLIDQKLELAEKLSGTVIQNNPENATYLDTYAWVLFKKKDYKLAKFYIESAINNDTDSSAVLIEHYGDILFHLDEKENAVIQWKKSLEMGNKSKVLLEKINKVIFIESHEED